MPPKPDLIFHSAPNDNETVHTAFNVELSPTKPDKDLSPTPRPLAPIIEDWVSDLEDDSKTKTPQNAPSFVQHNEQVKPPRPSVNHVETSILAATLKTANPKPKSHGNNMNRKECFMCKSLTHLIKDCDFYEKKMAQSTVRNHVQRENHKQYARMILPNPQRHVVPTTVLTQSKLVSITAVRPVTTAVPKTTMTRPRQAKTVLTKPNSLPRRHINRSPSLKANNFPPKVTAVKTPMVNAVKGVQRKWEWKPKCPILDHVFCNTSALMTLKRFDYNDALGRSNLNKKSYCLGVTDDYSRFTGVFILATKDETSPILKTFITGIENQLSLKVKIIRSDNGTEFKNHDLNQFCGMKGIKKEFSVPRTTQQNGIAERKNKTLIEAARTMLANLLLPIPFWAKAVNTACYVQNRVLVTKPQNKTPYALLHGRKPSIGFMRPFGCHVTILNTLDSLGKFDGKNTDGDATFDEKEPEFKGRKPESKVNVSPSSNTQSKKHDDKTNREDKGKIPAVGQLSLNSNNTFSAAGPLNVAVSPTHGKSSYADFNNLETSITVSPIPITRVHKDHHVTQIIGFEDLDYPDKVYKVVKISILDYKYWTLKSLSLNLSCKVSTIDVKLNIASFNFDEKVRIKVCAVDLQVSAVRLNVTAVSLKFLLFDVSEGFNQIIDFLNGSSVKYALTVNPNIYVSCIKQFWSLVTVKKVNDVTRLQALVDKKKVKVGKGATKVDAEDVPTAGVAAEGAASVADDYVSAAVDEPSIPSATPPTPPPKPSQDIPSTSQKVQMFKGGKQRAQIYQIDLERADKVLSMQDDEVEPAELQEVVEVVTTAKLITKVVTTTTFARELEAELNKNIDWDEVIDHVHRKEKEDNDVKRYQALKRKPQTEAQARKNMMIYLRNVAGFKMDYFKGMTYDDIRPIFEKKFNSNVAFLLKTKEKMDEEDSRALKRLKEESEVSLELLSFGIDAAKDFKENMLSD
nr:putative ribonuclease H-like domain-containing protein [Tanacetum cinerariifolium]